MLMENNKPELKDALVPFKLKVRNHSDVLVKYEKGKRHNGYYEKYTSKLELLLMQQLQFKI